ncbi:hypothetical protein ABZZ79_05490 [Streptomyces sp. NPDC006458]
MPDFAFTDAGLDSAYVSRIGKERQGFFDCRGTKALSRLRG